MIELVATRGYESLTVRGLARRARVSSGTIYSHYRTIDDCFLATFDLVCERASQRMVEASQNELEPRRRLESAIDCFFQDMAAAPRVAKFMLQAAPAAGPAFTSALRNSSMRLGVALEFCLGADHGPPPHPLLLEGMVAGLARIGRVWVSAGEEDEVGQVAAEAVEWIASLTIASAHDAELPVAAFPPGRRKGLSVPGRLRSGDWEETFGDERAMILAAAFQIARSGYHQLSIPRICREAGVSRRDFDRHFDGLDDCFTSALEERATRAIAVAMRPDPESATWADIVREALRMLGSAIEDDRDGARVLFVEITAAGTGGIESRDRLISELAHALRAIAPASQAPSELASEASAAAAWALLRRRVQDQSSATTAAIPILTLLILGPAVDVRSSAQEIQ